jgi:hypothetical protein
MEKITITPNLGYGSAELSMRSSSKSFGSQDGNEYRIGVVGSFYFSEYSAVTFGVRYIHTKLDINTHPDYEKFYGQMNQVQFAVGFAFD